MSIEEYNHLHTPVSPLAILDVKNVFTYLLPPLGSDLFTKCIQDIVDCRYMSVNLNRKELHFILF